MANTIADYVAASDNANEYSDDLLASIKPLALEDIDDLMRYTDDRDDELWTGSEVDTELAVSDYDKVPPQDRGLDWVEGLSAVATMAGLQFFLDNRDNTIIKPAAYRAQLMAPFNLTREQLVMAGKRKVTAVTLEGYQALQSKYVSEFAAIKSIGNAELYAELQSIGGLQPFEKHVADSMGYVSRMTNYPPGSPQYKEAVADLVNTNAGPGQIGMNRRSVESLHVQSQTNGDENLLMAWILDPTSSHCAYCPDRAGVVRTLGEWIDEGMPGADVCRGGNKCNCHLQVV